MQTIENLKTLSDYLKVSYDSADQDWEITNADDERVREFVDVYHSKIVHEEIDFFLVELIMHSLEKKITAQAIGRASWSEEEIASECQELAQILRAQGSKYDWIIKHVLSWRGNILEEEIEEYAPMLLLMEKEFPELKPSSL